jgi:hypothetical protein
MIDSQWTMKLHPIIVREFQIDMRLIGAHWSLPSSADSSLTSVLPSRRENFELQPNNQCASVSVSTRTLLRGRGRMPRTCRIRTFRGISALEGRSFSYLSGC